MTTDPIEEAMHALNDAARAKEECARVFGYEHADLVYKDLIRQLTDAYNLACIHYDTAGI